MLPTNTSASSCSCFDLVLVLLQISKERENRGGRRPANIIPTFQPIVDSSTLFIPTLGK
jgi:hypothetical protein